MGYERWHWSIVNIAGRCVGLMFGLVSLRAIADVAIRLTYRQPLNGYPSDPATAAYISLILAIVSALIAAGLLVARPYRPDLGDIARTIGRSGAKMPGAPQRPRNWWTGQPQD